MKDFFVLYMMNEIKESLINRIILEGKLSYAHSFALNIFYFYDKKTEMSIIIDVDKFIKKIKYIYTHNCNYHFMTEIHNEKLYELLKQLPLLDLQFILYFIL
jgi:hypothetical protein